MKGILLVNLGTPNSPQAKDVYRYLIEFLTDARVIDKPWLFRQLLVRGIIVPTRYKQSAKAYQAIWTSEGSPLMAYSLRVQKKLQEALGEQYVVELAMRYQNPSIEKGLQSLVDKNVEEILILPLFPQYASATTGSVYEKVFDVMKNQLIYPKLHFINHFATHPGYIEAICAVAKKYPLEDYDHILFSFHGLPQRQLTKADRHNYCLKEKGCCQNLCERNRDCYSAQCFATARAVAERLCLEKGSHSISFQSRLGKEPWIEPFTSDRLKDLASEGHKKVLVFCLSFVSDCLETIYEIGVEYQQEFKHAGGEALDYVEGLNDHPQWIRALKTMIEERFLEKGQDGQDGQEGQEGQEGQDLSGRYLKDKFF